MNQFRKILQTRIDNLIHLSNATGEINHKGSIGELRESYLRDFFRELIPNSVSLTSGFVSDAVGHISPQLDFIVTQNSSLPLISMREHLSIVPVESALLAAEIKSRLRTSDLAQLEHQNEQLAAMNLTGESGHNLFIIPTLILAYETDIASARLRKWMDNNGNTVACCVLNGPTMIRDSEIRTYKKDAHGIAHYGVLAFIARFHWMLTRLQKSRDFVPDLDIYLTGRPKKSP